jgi:hypothetical protein
MALKKSISIFFFIFANIVNLSAFNNKDSVDYKLELISYIVSTDSNNNYFFQPVVKITYLKDTKIILNTDKRNKLKSGDFLNVNIFRYYFLFNEIIYFKDKKRYNTLLFVGKEIIKGKKTKIKKGDNFYLVLDKVDSSYLNFLVTSTNKNFSTNYKLADMDMLNIYINYFRYLGDDIQFRFKLDSNLINLLVDKKTTTNTQ